MHHSGPQRQHPQSIQSCRGLGPAFPEVTAEDHPDKVRESEAGQPLHSQQVSQCITFHLHHNSPLRLREKSTITGPIRLHKLSKLLIARPIHNSVTIELQ